MSEGERARERSFRRREDGEAFAAARGLLRAILGFCAGREPGDIPLVDGPGGKPAIAPHSNPADIRFNMSRSGRRALYAVARSREVGVDLERIRPDFPCLRVGDRYFSPREAAAVRDASGAGRESVFFALWTLKEAFLKGTGTGLSFPPDRFEVALEPPRLVRVDGEPEAASRWSLRTLHPEPGYVAALAFEGPVPEIRFRELRFEGGSAILPDIVDAR